MSSAIPGKGADSGRSSSELHPSLRQPARPLPDPSLGMAFENALLDARHDPHSAETKTRWRTDDARREDYWRGYYDRKMMQAERNREVQYYPDYPRPSQRFLEYTDEGGTVYRSGSRT